MIFLHRFCFFLFHIISVLYVHLYNLQTFHIIPGAKTSNTCLASIRLHIDEVWTLERFESPQYAEYNELQKYFLYGDEEEAFMSHVITKQPDFYQVRNKLPFLFFRDRKLCTKKDHFLVFLRAGVIRKPNTSPRDFL